MENLEQPREPAFYPNNEINVIHDKTLQSIDSTLKRIEAMLLDFQKNKNPLKVIQDALSKSLDEEEESNKLSLKIKDFGKG